MRLDPELRQALEQTGLPWEITDGTKHRQIRVAGHLAGILPRGSGTAGSRSIKNTVCQIRRIANEVKQ